LREEVEMTLSSLVDVLEDGEIITHDEWKRRTKERLSSEVRSPGQVAGISARVYPL
jgi:hypothetical protein